MIRSLYDQLLAGRVGGLRRRIARSEGQALVEFALIVSLTSIVALGAISMTGSTVRDVLGNISGTVSGGQIGQTTTTGGTATTPTPPSGKKKKKKG